MGAKPIVFIILAGVILAPILCLVFAQRFFRENEGLRRGDTLPVAKLRYLDGLEIDTRSWRGAPLLLVLFLPTCKACRSEITNLESIAPSFPDLDIVLLSLDASLSVEEMPFPVVVDPSGEFIQKTRKAIVPTIYWIDAEGIVLYARTGPRSPEADAATFRDLGRQSEVRDRD
jgi:peroxiredoxin